MKEWIVGRNPVYEALRARRRQGFRLLLAQGIQETGRLLEIRRMAASLKIPMEQAARPRLDALGSNHQGVALECSAYPYVALLDILDRASLLSEAPFVLILDALQDPQNLGTLLRTAEATGIHGVLLPLRHTVSVTPAVVSASSGASEHLLVAQANLAQAIASLKDAGLWIIGLDGGPQAQPPERVRMDGPLALVVGSEGQGMRSLVRSSCDLLLRLPMRGQVESLNAAVAGSIALYMAWQQRGYARDTEKPAAPID
jgi:23S rRNA (guanosine2251-2'-O)-methyltransferase